jgi:hypothetical protein
MVAGSDLDGTRLPCERSLMEVGKRTGVAGVVLAAVAGGSGSAGPLAKPLAKRGAAKQSAAKPKPKHDPNRSVTITINAALINPADQQGVAWDGPNLSSSEIKVFAKVVSKQYPVGRLPIVGDIGPTLAAGLVEVALSIVDKPDATGRVTLTVGDLETSFELPKQPDSYTPTWNVRIESVPLERASLRIELFDDDVFVPDPIGTVTLNSDRLVAMEAKGLGKPYVIDTAKETGGMIHRLFVTIAAPPTTGR